MKGTIISIKPDGTQSTTEVDGSPRLEVLKAAIDGGYLEAVPGFDMFEHNGVLHDCCAFCDEEGKLKQFPINFDATMHWQIALRRAGHPGLMTRAGFADVLVGQIAVVFGDAEFMEAL
jgi:hypothetical protein